MKSCSMKQETIDKRIKQIKKKIKQFRVLHESERIFILNYIQWLSKFGHITEIEKENLVSKLYREYEKDGLLK